MPNRNEIVFGNTTECELSQIKLYNPCRPVTGTVPESVLPVAHLTLEKGIIRIGEGIVEVIPAAARTFCNVVV